MPALVSAVVFVALALATRLVAMALVGMLSAAATALTAREIGRPQPRRSVIFSAWYVVIAVLIPLLPPPVIVALAVPLATSVFVAGLVLRKREAFQVITGGLVVLTWQFVWLAVSEQGPAETAFAGVIIVAAVASGLFVVRTTRTALEKGQSRYESLFNGVPAGLYRSDPQGRILVANKPLAKMLGFADIRALMNTNANDLYFATEDRDQAIASIEEGHHKDVLYRLKRQDGTPIWVRETARVLTDDFGTVIGFEGLIEDVTKRTEAEQTALRAEERFSVAFEAAPIGMALVEMDGHIRRVNNAFGDLMGRKAEDLIGLNWRSITPPEDQASSVDPVSRLQPGGSVEYERRYYHASGATRWGRVSMAMFKDGPEQARRLVVQLADITPQKELQQHWEQLVRDKDEFVASVAHELRTPLTAVLGLTRELADSKGSFSDEERQELLQLVAEQSTDVANIVEDLLVAARSDIGGLTISRESIDLGTQVTNALRECIHLKGSRSIVVDTPEHPVQATADGTRLRQIIRNLLTNAFRYGGDEVIVEVGVLNGSARLCVRDNGSGLAPVEWERIFEPYYRAPSGGSVVGSIGLGLSVSKRLAEAMEGTLSYRFHEGFSMFELVLPVAE